MLARPLPWTAVDVLTVVHKHWIAAFGNTLPRRTKDTVKSALEALGRARRSDRPAPAGDVYVCRRALALRV